MTIVAFDGDFHPELARSGAVRPSVIRIRIEHSKGPAMADPIEPVVRTHSAALEAGAAVSVDVKGVRIRNWPLR